MSGPQFIGVYVAALVVALALMFALRRVVSRVPVAAAQAPLSLEEAAFLVGGPHRVVDSAVAGLIDAERLRVQRGGKLQAVGRQAAGERLEQAVFAYVREHDSRTLSQVRGALGDHDVVRWAHASLTERGLLVRPRVPRLLVPALPLLAVVALGVARLVNGVALHRPVGFLVLLLIVAVLVTGVALWPRARWLSAPGREVRASVEGKAPERNGHVGLPALTGAVGLVAVGGLVAFPDEAIAAQLRSAMPSSSSGGGDSSSCGGGGCGGGGCGG
ncbi:hypothetical protein GCM10017566_27410 [Amycolatopsis bartoniae]|uniref:TIGR04222 domain-containing membrane protein n=1 Tax=Amycolatopsis bartoniae TaxID=941986 RepID=A0A8H9IZW2_9PSEU|nr:hypothetical protein GCM10017566_27410 [Amycolatopsis bartoniae]